MTKIRCTNCESIGHVKVYCVYPVLIGTRGDDPLREILRRIVTDDHGVEFTDAGVWITDELLEEVKEAVR